MNGRVVAVVDLHAAESRPQAVVFTKNWARASKRTIRIEAVGTDRVDVDAFVVVR